MCIVFYTLSHPGYKLVLAANRDEFLDRPATPAAWHNFDSSDDKDKDNNWVLCGRDLGSDDKGTWLGMTKDLRVGILTNIRYPLVEPPPEPIPSRGHLLKMYLSPAPQHAPDLDTYMEGIESSHYVGFNLLLMKLHRTEGSWGKTECGYLSNRAVPPFQHPDEKGCHGMSNSPWAEPYSKVSGGEKFMQAQLDEWADKKESDEQLVERMMDVLAPAPAVTNAEDMTHATTVKPLLVTLMHEKTAGAGRWYGTRVSTVILVKDDGTVTFVERDISVLEGGKAIAGTDERRVVFQAEAEGVSEVVA